MSEILTDPANESRSPEEVAERCIAALDEVRSKTHRLAVVGQIRIEDEGPAHHVVLGPFSTRGVIDSEEKLAKAREGGSAAKTAGYGLAWDTKAGRGKGRFLLAPAFMRPRDAWDFFREERMPDHSWIKEWIERARGVSIHEPVCTCGLQGRVICRACGVESDRFCPKHEPGQKHICIRAA